jgi:hypothetical protein
MVDFLKARDLRVVLYTVAASMTFVLSAAQGGIAINVRQGLGSVVDNIEAFCGYSSG